MLDGVHMIKSVFASCWALDVPVELRECSLQIALIKVPSYNVNATRVGLLFFIYGVQQERERHASICVQWDVNSCDDHYC